MSVREDLTEAMKAAMKAGEKERLSVIRMVNAAIKDRDIASRDTGPGKIGDGEIVELMAKLVKSREDSVKLYEQGGRPELAAGERAEIDVIREFMPKQMEPDETEAAIRAVVAELGAAGMKDMGRVIAALKERYAGRMDFGKASGVVKAVLTAG
ncbi:MAG: GatB/YqeY domain-containing protein [Ancalomicrobiaceae bacterium]|nr:GatB/YqeY domain-containing protein [Ancalomicrobiaceae bacterium]